MVTSRLHGFILSYKIRATGKLDERSKSQGRVFALPLNGNSYTECLYAALRKLNVEVIEAIWSGRWLLANLKDHDVLHVHWPSFCYFDSKSSLRTWVGLIRFTTVLFFLKLRRVTIVWTAHNMYPHDGGKTLWSHRFARRFIVVVADTILTHGTTAASLIEREFGVKRDKIRVVPHGHWIGYYSNTISKDETRDRLNIGRDAFVYAFVGLCKPYKGLEGLIRTFAGLGREDTLLIAGRFQSQEYFNSIRQEIANFPACSIAFHPGFIENDDLQLYFKTADVIVLPYTEILTSGSAVMAMSFGRPVVAPKAGVLPDLVYGRSGVLYDPSARDGLSQAMREIRARWSDEREIQDHVSRFSWIEAAKVLRQIVTGEAP